MKKIKTTIGMFLSIFNSDKNPASQHEIMEFVNMKTNYLVSLMQQSSGQCLTHGSLWDQKHDTGTEISLHFLYMYALTIGISIRIKH